MNVGVYLGNLNPFDGGGYTFQTDVFAALLECSQDTHHTFVVFSSAPNLEPPISDRIRLVYYRRGWLERLVAKYLAEDPFFYQFQPLWHWSLQLEHLIATWGVEIMWFPSNMFVPVSLPYIGIVWDLQHRLQPYFPEVRVHGEWMAREQAAARMLQRAAAVITGTEIGREEIERFYQVPAQRIKLLPHPTPRYALNYVPGVDETQVLQKYGLPETYLFYPAQFWSHKNHAGLLLALAWLRRDYDLVFPLVLSGSDRGNLAYIQTLVQELQLESQVHILGFIPQEDLAQLYRNAFALTYLSFFGPENLPPLEAFALGCPVIAADVAGAKEQLGDAALLVDPKSPEQLALAVKTLKDDPQLRQTLIERGRQRATRFTSQDFVKGIFALLEELEPICRCWSRCEPYRPV